MDSGITLYLNGLIFVSLQRFQGNISSGKLSQKGKFYIVVQVLCTTVRICSNYIACVALIL